MEKVGTLACVGLGMTLGAHISPRSRSHIEQADVVFAAVSAAFAPIGMPAMTLPFVLVVWVFVLAAPAFPGVRRAAVE